MGVFRDITTSSFRLNYHSFNYSYCFTLCLVLCFSITSATPHGHLHGILKSFKYGGGGGVSPTAIDGQIIVPYNGASSYAGAGSYASASSNAASFSSSKTGTYNFAAQAPFGLGPHGGLSGANSDSLASASSNSGAVGGAGSGNLGGSYSSPYIAPSNGCNLPTGGCHNSGSLAGSQASSGAVSGAATFGSGVNSDQQYNDGSYGNYGTGGNINYGSSLGFTDQQTTNTGFNKQDKTEGTVITDVQNIPNYSLSGAGGIAGASANAGAGNFDTFDSEYDRGFQTIVTSARPVDTAVNVMKPSAKFPQTSYGYVPEGQTGVIITDNIQKKNHKGVNKIPDNTFYNTGSININPSYDQENYNRPKPTSPPSYQDTKVVVNPNKKVPQYGTPSFNSDNAQANAQAGSGAFVGNVKPDTQYPNNAGSQTTFTHTGQVTTDTKYTGNFGGGPGFLGEQKPPGYSVNNGGSIGASHAQAGAGAASVAGVQFGGVNSGHKDTTQSGSVYNTGNEGKYTGSFGGGPGILGDQKPQGYAVNKGGSVGAAGVSHSNAAAGAGSVSGSFGGGVHTGHKQSAPTGSGDAGKYTGSFGGSPGVLGDQRPAGYAITGGHGGITIGGSIGAAHSQAGAVAASNAGAHTGSDHNSGDGGKYTGSFGGGPGVLGDQKPPGYAITGAHPSSVHSGAGAASNAGAGSQTGSINGNIDGGKYSGSFGGSPGVLGDQRPAGYAVNKGNVGIHNQGAVAGSGANAGAFAGASANAGAGANAGRYGGSYDQQEYTLQAGHVSLDGHQNTDCNSKGGGCAGFGTAAGNAGAYGGSGSFGVGIHKQGSLTGGLVKGILNDIGAAAAAGTQALSSSHSASLGHGLSLSGGVSSSFAGAGSSSHSASGCCG